MSDKKIKKNNYATNRSLLIRPIIQAEDSFSYIFRRKEFAIKRIYQIKQKYIVSNIDENIDNKEEVHLWIRGFNLTDGEREIGLKGNFACIFISKVDDPFLILDENGMSQKKKLEMHLNLKETQAAIFYTLNIKKVFKEKRLHPDRRRSRQRHPNAGHPILREIEQRKKDNKTYEDKDTPLIQLKRLHIEYPETTYPIPPRTLLFMIYEQDDIKGPVKKKILKVKENKEGRFYIEMTDNPIEGKIKRSKINIFPFSTF